MDGCAASAFFRFMHAPLLLPAGESIGLIRIHTVTCSHSKVAGRSGVGFIKRKKSMTHCKSYLGMLAVTVLTACGGGSGTSSGGNSSATTYNFITPKAGTQLVFSETLVDNLNNTLNRTVVENVTSINADGSFTSTWADPSGDTDVSGVVDHTQYPTTFNYNSAAQGLSWGVTPYTYSPYGCAVSPHAAGAPSPLSAGQSWTFSYTQVCGSNPTLTLTQSGTFVGTESVTVPDGTFNAYKFQSTLTYTESSGTTVVQSITSWRNAAGTDSRSLKDVVNYTYSGSAPLQGSLVSFTRILQSFQ